MKTKIAAALAALITTATLAPAAKAGDGILTFGGSTLCSEILANPSDDIWRTWIAGFWSALNMSGAANTAPWVGEHFRNTSDILSEVRKECRKNTRQDFQSVVLIVYAQTYAKAAPTS